MNGDEEVLKYLSFRQNSMSAISRPTARSRSDVSLSIFSLLFSEVIGLASQGGHLEEQLHAIGKTIGERCLALFHLRDRPFRRETSPTSCLQFIATSIWRQLFGRPSELLSTDQPNEWYLVDRGMLLNRFISVSAEAAKEGSMVNCASLAAGIIEGMMQIAGFPNTKVEAVYTHSGSVQVVEDHMNVTFVVSLDKRSVPVG